MLITLIIPIINKMVVLREARISLETLRIKEARKEETKLDNSTYQFNSSGKYLSINF